MRIILFLLIIAASLWANDTTLTILYTNNVNGTLDNCLCPEKPYGALEKIKYQVDRLRKDKKNLLFLDAGDFFTPFGDRYKDSLLLEAVRYLNYNVMTPGDQAFNHGTRSFLKNIKPRIPMYVSANLLINGKSIAKPYKLFKFNGITIAVLGMTSESAFKYYAADKLRGLKVLDPVQALRDLLPAIREKADFIILLSHSGYENDRNLAITFPQIDLIIGAHSQNILEKAERIHKTLITQAGSDGYYLGRLDINFTNSGKRFKFKSELIPMELSLPNDPHIAQLAIEYSYTLIKVSKKKLKYIDMISKEYLSAPAESCKKCHHTQFNHWKKGAHARAFQSIKEKKKTKLLRCVSCHVTGFGRPDGYINRNLTPQLSAVTCSECHLTFKAHLTSKNKQDVQPIEEKTCTRCHNYKNDADFNYNEALKKIRH